MKKIKKIVAALAAAATVSAFGVCAYADVNTTGNYFFFDLNGKGASDWAKAEKENDEDYAYVTTTGGYVSSSSPIYVAIYKEQSVSSSNLLSRTTTITDSSDDYTIQYTTHRGTGAVCYLRGNCGYNSAEVRGYWNP